MQDTYYNSRLQKSFFLDGTPKGMKQVLGERGLSVNKMETEDTRENFRAFMIKYVFESEKTKVESLVLKMDIMDML